MKTGTAATDNGEWCWWWLVPLVAEGSSPLQGIFASLITPVAPFFASNLVLVVKLTSLVLMFFRCCSDRFLDAAATLVEEVGGGRGGEGGRLHNGGEENKAWKAWRLAGGASALPDTPSSLPNQQKGEPKHHHAVSPFPLLACLGHYLSPFLG